jgi:hypothetical protein
MESAKLTTAQVIEQTRKWITEVVIACNFCPFAAREVKRGSIHYQVDMNTDPKASLQHFLQECKRLDEQETIETTLLIFPHSFSLFPRYLDLVHQAERLLRKQGYEGIYQVATFHPDYRFADSAADDAANYTNRSPYPMLHLLREASIEQALARYADPGNIPERNISFAREKGTAYMKLLRDNCL